MKEHWQSLKEKTWFKILSNKFVITSLLFTVWMLFLDVNSWLIHRELNEEIDQLEESIRYYRSEIAKDREQLHQLNSSSENLERYAREQFHLVKPGEEIYLIELPEATD
jgi:cell division protein FtsB